MISSILKEQTKHLHDETEKNLRSQKIFEQAYTIDDYKHLLVYNFKLINAYEALISDKLKDFTELELDLRNKTDVLKKELRELNLSTDTENTTYHLKNIAEAFGVLYVIEGSTLGGNVIAKQLKKNPDFQHLQINYFGLYGENTGSLWTKFKTILDQNIQAEDYDDCLNGTKKAYGILS